MAGVKGMVALRPKQGTTRCKVWQSMRILRRFTIPDLCRTSGGSISNVRKFVRALATHGYVAAYGDYVSGRPGLYQAWRLVRNIGKDYPTVCDRCGNVLGKPCEVGKNDEQ
jgi:hypothetical protein